MTMSRRRVSLLTGSTERSASSAKRGERRCEMLGPAASGHGFCCYCFGDGDGERGSYYCYYCCYCYYSVAGDGGGVDDDGSANCCATEASTLPL